MPSFIASPEQIVISGARASFDPPYVGAGSPLVLKIAFPTVKFGPGKPEISQVTTPKLDRLQRQMTYFNPDGTPAVQMQVIWQQSMEAIERAFQGLTGQVGDLEVILSGIQAALDLAQAANDKASETKAQQDITNSYTEPTSVLTANSSGGIQIIAHTRVYGDGTRVSVNGGAISGFQSGDYVSVYYDDAARVGGTVSYQGTTNAIAQAGARHSVGQILIPAAGQTPSTGGGVSPPGYTPNRLRPGENEL